MDQEIMVKLCVVGEPNVGKTSMLTQYCFNKFDPTIKPTVGCDFNTKINLIDGSTVRLQLWDIAGQERFNSVSKMYVRGAFGCIIVCSADDGKTLDETLKWKRMIDENCDPIDHRPIPCLLVQNKIDLVKTGADCEDFQRRPFVDKFAKDNGFFAANFVSAKENINVKESVDRLMQEIVRLNLLSIAKSDKGDSKLKLKPALPTETKPKKGCDC